MSDVLPSLSSFGESLLSWCLAANLSTVILLAAALIADVALSRRLAASWRIALYLPVLLRVLIPLDMTWAVPFWTLPAPAHSHVTLIAPFVVANSAPAVLASGAESSHWTTLAVSLYLTGIAAFLLIWLRDARKLRRIIARSQPDQTDSGILVSPIAGPMVAGVIRPRIIIPSWLIGSEALPLILAHEKAHIARRDPLVAGALRLVCTLAWPVLPVWIASSRILALIEHACDDLALGVPAARHQETIMKYAQAMIEVAHRSTHMPRSLAFGSSLRSRIASLRPARRWPAALQVALALITSSALVACSVARPGVAHNQDQGEDRPLDQSTNEAQPASNRRITWDLRDAAPAAPRPRNLVDSPSLERRIVNVRIISGHAPVAGLYDNPSAPKVVITDRDQLLERLMQLTDVNVIAAPRLLVHIDQPSAVQVGGDQQSFSVQMQVHPSAPGTTHASLSYVEGSTYILKSFQLHCKKGESCVISIPSAATGQPPRTLIITIDKPGEESAVGC